MSAIGLELNLPPIRSNLSATAAGATVTGTGLNALPSRALGNEVSALSSQAKILSEIPQSGTAAVGILATSLDQTNAYGTVPYSYDNPLWSSMPSGERSLYSDTVALEKTFSRYYRQQWGVELNGRTTPAQFMVEQANNPSLTRSYDAVEVLAQNYALLNPPYNMETGMWNGRAPGTIISDAEASRVYNNFTLMAAANMAEDARNSFLVAFDNRSLNVQAADTVPGLNYRLNETRFIDSNGEVRRTASPTYNYLPELMGSGRSLVGGGVPGVGAVFITW